MTAPLLQNLLSAYQGIAGPASYILTPYALRLAGADGDEVRFIEGMTHWVADILHPDDSRTPLGVGPALDAPLTDTVAWMRKLCNTEAKAEPDKTPPVATLADWQSRAKAARLDRMRFLGAADGAALAERHCNDAHATYIGQQRRALTLLADDANAYREHCEAMIADLLAHDDERRLDT